MSTIKLSVLAVAIVAALTGGCASGPLTREEKLRAVRQRNRELQAELRETRRKLAGADIDGAARPATDETEDPYRATDMRFGRFTGPLDSDGDGTPERLKVVVEPLDAEGDVVKRGGRLEIALYAGDATDPLETWSWDQQTLGKTWLTGPGLYAYVLKLAWPGGSPPEAKRLRLEATFTTIDGRALGAATTVKPGGE